MLKQVGGEGPDGTIILLGRLGPDDDICDTSSSSILLSSLELRDTKVYEP